MQTETAAESRPTFAKTVRISVWRNLAAPSLQVCHWQLSGSGGNTQDQFLLGPVDRQVAGEQPIPDHAIDLLSDNDRFNNLWA